MAFSPVKYKQQRPRTETANWVTSRVRLWQRNVWRSSDWQMWISNLDEGWGGVEGQVTRPKSLQVQQCNVWAYKSKHRDLDNWVSISNFKINLIHYWVVKIFQLIFNKSLPLSFFKLSHKDWKLFCFTKLFPTLFLVSFVLTRPDESWTWTGPMLMFVL